MGQLGVNGIKIIKIMLIKKCIMQISKTDVQTFSPCPPKHIDDCVCHDCVSFTERELESIQRNFVNSLGLVYV